MHNQIDWFLLHFHFKALICDARGWNQNGVNHSATCIRRHLIFLHLILPSFPSNPPEKPPQLQRVFMSLWASMGASQRNLSIHEKCRVSQTQPDRPFGDNRCLIWLRTGPGYRATVVCSLRLQSWRYFLTKFLCHTGCNCRYRRKHGKFGNKSCGKTQTQPQTYSQLLSFLFQFVSHGKSWRGN